MPTPTVEVRIGPCSCPGEPHDDGDVVQLRERLSLAAGTQLQSAIVSAGRAGMSPEAVTGVLGEQYLLVGVVGWNLTDRNGAAMPVNADTIREHLLDDFERGAVASDRADDLYAERYILPLVQRAANSSPDTTTDESTSPTPSGSESPLEPSTPSSIESTQTADTAATSR